MYNDEKHYCVTARTVPGSREDCLVCKAQERLNAKTPDIVASRHLDLNYSPGQMQAPNPKVKTMEQYNAVEPPHYQRGPKVVVEHECGGAMVGHTEYTIKAIDVFRAIQDPRFATAFKYIWRVAFGGKDEPWDSRDQQERDTRDINSAIWYLQDYIVYPPAPLAVSPPEAYT